MCRVGEPFSRKKVGLPGWRTFFSLLSVVSAPLTLLVALMLEEVMVMLFGLEMLLEAVEAADDCTMLVDVVVYSSVVVYFMLN